MEKKEQKQWLLWGVIVIAAYLNAIAMQYLWSISGDDGSYIGMQIYAFMPESLVWFGLTVFFLFRLYKQGVWKQKGKLILSCILGFSIAFSAVLSQELYFHLTLFEDGGRLFRAVLASAGMMMLTVPLMSELTTLFDKGRDYAARNRADGKKMKPAVYGLLIWGITFVSYIPMLLYTWPINLFGDASDALGYDYLGGRMSTHHTPIHWLLMGWAYDYGLEKGAPAKGMLLFTIVQMLILSGSIAFLSYYIYKKKYNSVIRRIILLISWLNPIHSYFAVTAEKGTIGIALALIGVVLMCEILDDQKNFTKEDAAKAKMGWKTWLRIILFIVIVSGGCLFRNNMMYAILAGGFVIAVLSKGIKNKAVIMVMILLTCILYKGEFKAIVQWQGLKTTDQYQETFPLPIMCLARIAILHADEMPAEMYREILEYIPEQALAQYNVSISDGVKALANEQLLQQETRRFLMLFLKGGLKYPADYLDQFSWLTFGYFNPAYAHVIGSTTPVFYGGLRGDYTDIEVKNLLPGGGKLLPWMYSDDTVGRFRIPIFSWFFRPAIYAWFCIYAFLYGIYTKSRRKIALSMIPLMYFGTILLGPMIFFRYMYLNALFLGFMVYLMLEDS